MTDAIVFQSRVYSSTDIAVFPQIPQARVLALYNIPADFTQVSQGFVLTAVDFHPAVEVAQARVFGLARGRTGDPVLRAWTFTLDGHDFYVLRLGDASTLIYDFYSEQWIEWTSGTLPFWRASSGMNWLGAVTLAAEYGSNIVVGDDTYGLLWFLDPEQPYDDHPDEERARHVPFPRIVTGQMLAKGRQVIPCYAIFLAGDNYGLSDVDFTPGVTLETSDDQGRTFYTHETINVPADYTQALPYEWLSLGQIESPGWIFRVTDNGVFARIDAMEMNDAG